MEWDYSGRKGRDGQKKKIGKANERKGKSKWGKDKEVNGQGGKRGAPAPHGAVNIRLLGLLHTPLYPVMRYNSRQSASEGLITVVTSASSSHRSILGRNFPAQNFCRTQLQATRSVTEADGLLASHTHATILKKTLAHRNTNNVLSQPVTKTSHI